MAIYALHLGHTLAQIWEKISLEEEYVTQQQQVIKTFNDCNTASLELRIDIT